MAENMFKNDINEIATTSQVSPFDAIVVGAGSAGLTVARSLYEGGAKVLLLEAGPAPFLSHIANTDLRYARQLSRSLRDALAYRQSLASGGTFGPNYSCLGGRGLFWNGASPRYAMWDFQHWPAEGVPEEADYAWAENQFRVTTAMGRTPMAERIIALAARAMLAVEPGPFAADIDDLYVGRLSAGIGSGLGLFLRGCGDAVMQGKLTVAINSRVHALIIDANLAKGVVVETADGALVEVLARAVVLSGGGLESVKLAAGSEVPDAGERIGKGIQEHLFYTALLNAPELYDADDPSSAILYMRSLTQDGHQWELHAPGNRLFAVDDGTAWKPSNTSPYELMIRSFAATEKRDDNWLEAKAGPLGSSTVHFSLSPADSARKSAIATDAGRLAGALKATPNAPPDLDSVERFRPIGSSYHEAGGLDMGLDPLSSVTLPDGRFHSVDNLVCADASAFPRIAATNPHLTIVAVARRKGRLLADRLAQNR